MPFWWKVGFLSFALLLMAVAFYAAWRVVRWFERPVMRTGPVERIEFHTADGRVIVQHVKGARR